MKKPPVCLTIAGLDPSGGAGIIADIKTFTAFGCFATAAVSALTFQNTTAVFGSVDQTRESVRGQVEPVIRDFEIAAMKTGMLPSSEVIEETTRLIVESSIENVVVDPVVRSTSGYDLIDELALRSLIDKLFPVALVITPNLPEAERICGMPITSVKDIVQAGSILLSLGPKNVLIKGGHIANRNSAGDGQQAVDYLFTGRETLTLSKEFLKSTSTHGSGCTLSAAIAANLALGKPISEAVRIAKDFVFEGIKNAPNLGHGHSPLGTMAIVPKG